MQTVIAFGTISVALFLAGARRWTLGNEKLRVFISDYVAGEIITEMYHDDSMVGFITLLGIVIAALTGFASSFITRLLGRQYMIVAGLIAWTAPEVADLIRTSSAGGRSALPSSQWCVPVLYVVGYGVGRGVFDSSLRVLYATLFPTRLEQIFALSRVGEGVAAAASFLICPCHHGRPLQVITIVVGAVALVSHGVIERMNPASQTDGRKRDSGRV